MSLSPTTAERVRAWKPRLLACATPIACCRLIPAFSRDIGISQSLACDLVYRYRGISVDTEMVRKHGSRCSTTWASDSRPKAATRVLYNGTVPEVADMFLDGTLR